MEFSRNAAGGQSANEAKAWIGEAINTLTKGAAQRLAQWRQEGSVTSSKVPSSHTWVRLQGQLNPMHQGG